MFRSLFDTIVGTISNLNPLKHFIKYALDKTLNQFLKKELTLEDFKNGPLNLQNIEINSEKINRSHLVSSPYILHFGIIENLKITLPPLSDLSTQSIQISISGVQIVLKPNKNFSQSFKEKMIDLHEMQKYFVEQKQVQGQISQTGPVDFFKQLLKKIIINIKVNISRIAVKLYMNTPSEDRSNPQFYLMLRIPLIYLDKKQDKQIKKNQVQELSFNILLPQISVHLLSEDIRSSEYENMKCKTSDFPFMYPPVTHPRTILLIGSSIIPDNIVTKLPEWKKDGRINSMNFTQLSFKLTTDYKKKSKDITMHTDISNIEVMVTPVQIKILSRFVAQVMEFKKILDSVMQQLKVQSGDSMTIMKKKSNDSMRNSSTNNDLFSSIMMSLSGDMAGGRSQSRDTDMFKSIMREDKLMRDSVREFNLQFEKKMKKMQGSQSQTIQFQVIQFKQSLKVHIEFTNLNLYILKYTSNQEYLRIWGQGQQKNQNAININKKIGCDYFMFEVKKIDVLIKAKQKLTYINLKSLSLMNVKLCEPKIQKSDESFYEMGDSFDFQASKEMSKNPINGNLIIQYTPAPNAHYCVQEILTVSQSQSQNRMQQKNVRKYSLIPQIRQSSEDAYILYKPAVSLHLDNKQKYFKINLQIITVTANLELCLDLLHIVYPMMAYKRLADMVTFKRGEAGDKNQPYPAKESGSGVGGSKKSIFESMYEYRQDIESYQDLVNENKNTLLLEIVEAKIGFRKGQFCYKTDKGVADSNFRDLIRKEKQKMYEEQSFCKQCFCNINETGVYLQLQNLRFQKKLSAMKLSCKVIDVGLLKISSSQIASISSVLSLKPIRPDDSIRLLKQNTHCQCLYLYVPQLCARFSEEDIVNVVDIVVDSIKIIGELAQFREYLVRELLFFEKKSSDVGKKQKKNEGAVEKQFKVYIQKVAIQLQYCAFVIEQIYFNLNQVQDSMVCKISKLVGGVKRQKSLKLKLCEFKNDVMQATLYPDHTFDRKKQKEKDRSRQRLIGEGDIFLQIHDADKPHILFKAEQRNIFFEKLDKHNFSIVFQLIKRQIEGGDSVFVKKESGNNNNSNSHGTNSNGGNGINSRWLARPFSGQNTFSQKFKFKQVNPAIEEEGEKKIIILEICKQIKISACNVLQLKSYGSKIEKFTKFLKTKIGQVEQKLKSQTMLVMDRKHSAQIESESLEIILKIGQPISIDIRPDFIRNENQRIFSSTRSVLTINLHRNLSILFRKDKDCKQINGQISIAYHFLYSNDRQVDTNPLIFRQDRHLNELGFRTVLQVNRISLRLHLNSINKALSIKIRSILGQSSLQTLCLMQLHFQHVINHHVRNQIGISVSQIYDGDDFEVLEYDAEADPDMDDVVIIGHAPLPETQELEIEDLTGALEIYQEKLNNKKKEENVLRARSYVFQPCPAPQISIQQLKVQRVCFRISSNNQFDFVRFSGNQSMASKRTRVKEAQDMDYYVLEILNFMGKLDMQSQQNINNSNSSSNNEGQTKKDLNIVSSFAKIQKIGIYYGKQKHYGYSSLKYLQGQTCQSCFVILTNQNQLCVVYEQNPQKILIKTYCLKLKIGGTTEIITTLKKVKLINQQIQRSGWRKIYDKLQKQQKEQSKQASKLVKKDTKTQNQRIIVMIPQSSIRVTFQYANFIKIVDEQLIEMKEFILNEEARDKFQIQLKIRRWVKNMAKNNLGSLIGGTALNLLVKLFSQLVKLNVWWLSKLLGVFFGGAQ